MRNQHTNMKRGEVALNSNCFRIQDLDITFSTHLKSSTNLASIATFFPDTSLVPMASFPLMDGWALIISCGGE